MKSYYVDLHIHIGRTYKGKAVKITGSKSLTLTNILEMANNQKGLHMVGVIDCHSPEVIEEIDNLLHSGELIELEGGGLAYQNVTLILGSELEIYDESCQGPIHVLCYFPTLRQMKKFSCWLSNYVTNIQLSSQRVYVTGKELQQKTKDLDGLFIPAHVFTPFKSLYGKGVKQSLEEVFEPTLIDAIELGLSANTKMADLVKELHRYPFITNSDAHSLAKLAREYQVIKMEQPTFSELKMALKKEQNRSIFANYGLDPLLGKYHTTTCAKCTTPINEALECPNCMHGRFVKGVSQRIQELTGKAEVVPHRPPYIHQIPLEFIPGLGKKTLEMLIDHFGTEMAIIHEVAEQDLLAIIPKSIVNYISSARQGTLMIEKGGGGRYGKIVTRERK